VNDPSEKFMWESRLYFYKGDYRSAYDEISKALEYKTTNLKWQNLQNYYLYISQLTENYSVFTSTHFVFKAQGADVLLAPYALETLEKAYSEVGADLGFYPADKVLVEVYNDKKSFSAASTLSEDIIEKTGTVGICKFNRLMILSPQTLPLGYSWLDTLCHEYTHFLVNHLSGAKCPLWLHEGIARYHETRWDNIEPDILNQAAQNILYEARKKKQFITFKRMSPSLVYLKNQQEIMLAFTEVSIAVDLMKKKYGNDGVTRLLVNMSRYNEDKAFKQTLGVSMNSFQNELSGYINRLKLERSMGALTEDVNFNKTADDQFVGADARGSIRLGDKMREINRFDAALVNYKNALAAEPSNPLILLKIARACLGINDYEEAVKYLKLAIEKNPHYVTPYEVLGEIYATKKTFVEACKAYNQALAINPFNPITHRNLAVCYGALNDFEGVEVELKAAYVLNPEDTELKVLLENIMTRKKAGNLPDGTSPKIRE
jgi:tetratricopeptide (TPR) repeat protein